MAGTRKGTCKTCGVTFIARPRGPIAKHCPKCEPEKGNRSRRARLERTEVKEASNVVAPGVGGPNEALARAALAPLLVAAHLRAAGNDYERAASLAGLNPEALDLEALRTEVEEHHEDLVTGSVDGLMRVSSMLASATLTRLLTTVHDLPVGQLGTTLKAALEASERMQENFGATSAGITVVMKPRTA